MTDQLPVVRNCKLVILGDTFQAMSLDMIRFLSSHDGGAAHRSPKIVLSTHRTVDDFSLHEQVLARIQGSSSKFTLYPRTTPLLDQSEIPSRMLIVALGTAQERSSGQTARL